MKKILAIIFLLCANYVFAQDTTATASADTDNTVYTVVEWLPEFPGGKDSLFKFIADNLKYPEEVKELSERRTVYINFIVEKDGSLSHLKVAKGLTESLDNEALRVVKLMPKWIPGKHNGTFRRVQLIIPIKFVSK